MSATAHTLVCPNPKCGHAVRPGKKFCTQCGTPLAESNRASPSPVSPGAPAGILMTVATAVMLDRMKAILPEFAKWFEIVHEWYGTARFAQQVIEWLGGDVGASITITANRQGIVEGYRDNDPAFHPVTWELPEKVLGPGANDIEVVLDRNTKSPVHVELASVAAEGVLVEQVVDLSKEKPEEARCLRLVHADGEYDAKHQSWLLSKGRLAFQLNLPQGLPATLKLSLAAAKKTGLDLSDILEEIMERVIEKLVELELERSKAEQSGSDTEEISRQLEDLREYRNFHSRELEPFLRSQNAKSPPSDPVKPPPPRTAPSPPRPPVRQIKPAQANLPRPRPPRANVPPAAAAAAASAGAGLAGRLFFTLLLLGGLGAAGAYIWSAWVKPFVFNRTGYDDLLAYAPPNSQIVYGANLEAARENAAFEQTWNSSMEQTVKMMPQARPYVELMKNAQKLVAAAEVTETSTRVVVVLQTKTAYDKQQLTKLAVDQGGQKRRLQGVSYYRFHQVGPAFNAPAMLLAMPSDRLLILASVKENELPAVLDRGGQSPQIRTTLLSRVRKLEQHPAWLVAVVDDHWKEQGAAMDPELRRLEAVSLWTELQGGTLQLNLSLGWDSSAVARKQLSTINEQWQGSGKPALQDLPKQLPDSFGLRQLVTQVINSLRFKQDGTEVVATVKISMATLQTLNREAGKFLEGLNPR